MRSGSLASAVAATAGLGPGGALRHRCKVITLTPSARAISLCNFPCVANSFACASLLAISALECLFLLAIVVSLRPHVAFDLLMLTNFVARCFDSNKCSGSASKKHPHRLPLDTRQDEWGVYGKGPGARDVRE